jgi:cell division septation protein DedD
MSESLKPRFAVDFNEIERQLAQTRTAPAPAAPASRNDPLAELARIVGQDDPFQSLLAHDGAARPRQQSPAADDLFARRDAGAPAGRQAQPRGQQGGYADPGYDRVVDPRGAAQGHSYPSASSPQGEAAYDDNGGYAQEYYDEAEAQQASSYGQSEPQTYPVAEKRRSRKGLAAVSAIVAAGLLGGAAAYVYGGGSGSGESGAPPLVMATSAPTKVQPQNPGGVEIPNQNKQIYERASQTPQAKDAKESKIVNREEQPVDVKQAVRMNGATADATGATVSPPPAPAQQPSGGLSLGEPRRVRTIAIRPDGTLIQPQPEPGGARPGPIPLPAMTLPAEARTAPPAQATPSASTPVQVASAQPVPVQPRPAASTPVAASATPAAAKPVAAASTPTSGSSPQRVASVEPVATAPAPVTATEGATGGYAVQLGLANSETAAGATLAQLQRKHPDLNGKPSMIRKAEVNGNTIYRVRIGPLAKEEASSLCSKVQGQGGQCFVAKN